MDDLDNPIRSLLSAEGRRMIHFSREIDGSSTGKNLEENHIGETHRFAAIVSNAAAAVVQMRREVSQVRRARSVPLTLPEITAAR
jgi:hypothetical protein